MSGTALLASMGVGSAALAIGWTAQELVVRQSRPASSMDLGLAGLVWIALVRRLLGRSRSTGHDHAALSDVHALRSALAAGASVPAAFDVVARGSGPWASSASGVVRQLRAGTGLADTLDGWALADRGGPRALVVDALLIATESGGSQAGALDAVASTLVERQALEREVRALSSQARASAVVLVVTPLVFAAAVAFVDPRIRAFYVASMAGPLCLVGGGLLDACGAWWMARLVRRVS